ncbi:hypothetical protein N9A94_03650 [Akkermansiaceae bacterium]|nr:hypothetical protein [Akkermansiaceae bacterium]MDB4544819.1 hypothetical protein [Akkermansiaceae bacterium]
MADSPTAFIGTAKQLARQLREAAVDHCAFEQKLPICELTKCRATCCHDGVILSDEEARGLREHGGAEGVFQLPDGRWKTKTREASSSELADGFPAHFSKTRCAFLDNEHRCLWQLRAVEEGKHPWFYKPTSCWMHPLLLVAREGRPILTVLSSGQDHKKFASHTPCGREEVSASPARTSLKAELEMLAEISRRDFPGELNAPGI